MDQRNNSDLDFDYMETGEMTNDILLIKVKYPSSL